MAAHSNALIILIYRSSQQKVPSITESISYTINKFNGIIMRKVYNNKPKENLLHDVRKRFQYHPTAKQKPIVKGGAWRAPPTSKDDQEDFSTVKDKNDFNDSSWLAKLVNGIEECPNGGSQQALTDINVDCQTFGKVDKGIVSTKNPSMGSIFTIERKNSGILSIENFKRGSQRKSVPSASESKSKRNSTRKGSLSSIQANTDEKPAKDSKENVPPLAKVQDKKGTPKSKIVYPQYLKREKRNRTSGEKNSIVNYSSIKEQENNCDSNAEFDFRKNQAAKNQGPGRGQLQLQNMEIRIEEAYSTDKKNSEKKYSYCQALNGSQQPQMDTKQLEKASIENPKPLKANLKENLIANHQVNKINEIQSFNEFLFPQMLQDGLYDKMGLPQLRDQTKVQGRIGVIRKNKNKTPRYPDQDKENQNCNAFDNIRVEYKRSSPKRYNYTKQVQPHNESVMTIKKTHDSPIKRSHDALTTNNVVSRFVVESRNKFEIMFNKINQDGDEYLHRGNLRELNLEEEERYECGSILSKIKYLNQKYSKHEFVSQCQRIHAPSQQLCERSIKTESNQFQRKVNQKLPPQLSTDKLATKTSETTFAGARELKTSYSQLFGARSIENQPILHDERARSYQVERPRSYQLDHKIAPNKSPYLEMSSIIDGKPSTGNDGKDLGVVIENLNSKLNNYIQFNHLEDTYRKFKLDFAQLKRNMAR